MFLGTLKNLRDVLLSGTLPAADRSGGRAGDRRRADSESQLDLFAVRHIDVRNAQQSGGWFVERIVLRLDQPSAGSFDQRGWSCRAGIWSHTTALGGPLSDSDCAVDHVQQYGGHGKPRVGHGDDADGISCAPSPSGRQGTNARGSCAKIFESQETAEICGWSSWLSRIHPPGPRGLCIATISCCID